MLLFGYWIIIEFIEMVILLYVVYVGYFKCLSILMLRLKVIVWVFSMFIGVV